MTTIDRLEKDINILNNSITGIETKLDAIHNGSLKTSDPALVTTLIETKDRARLLLSQKEADLKFEKDKSKAVLFGGIKMNADDKARLSVGGSLKTSSLDKGSLSEDARKEIIDQVYKNEPDDTKRANQLLKEGIIVQRKM